MAILSVRGVSEDVQRALRVRAAETGETMGQIVERALRKELGMMQTALTWQVIEDNSGGLHLAVHEGGRCIYYATGYEYMPDDSLREDIEALRSGTDTSDWETQGQTREEMQDAYDQLTSHEHGWQVVADQDGVYPDRMGAAARLAFGIEEE